MIGVEEFAAPLRMFDRRRWRGIREAFGSHVVEEWRRYAPNMTEDNVISTVVYGPDNILAMHPDMLEGGYSEGSTISSQMGRFRPIPELSGYRTLLPNLYNCSSNMHSGSGIGRGSSLNCFRTIAADLGLDGVGSR